MDYIQNKKQPWLVRFIQWREEHISAKNFTLILAVLVGLCSAFAALVLKTLIHTVQHFLTENFSTDEANYLYLLYPVVGIFIAGLFIRYIVRDDIGHGVTKILYAISRKQAHIRPHNMYSSVIASSITIGFGGSVGAEAPIVLTGSAIGSNLGRLFRVDARTMMLLVGCGAAGAVAGIFKAPIAGLVFTIEVLLIDLTMSSLMPLLISSVTAATVSYIATGTESMFRFTMANSFTMERIPYVILMGVICGFVSLYFSETMNKLENFFRRYKNPYVKFVIGGIALSLLIFLFPSLYGEGYETIELLLNGASNAEWGEAMSGSFFSGHSRMLLVYLALVVMFKVFATTATNAGCSLCARLRRGALHRAAVELGCRTVALGHHQDDAAETMLMSLLSGATLDCFAPKSYLDRREISLIRPMVFIKEQEIEAYVRREGLPVVKSRCPVDGDTHRQRMKELVAALSEEYGDVSEKVTAAMQKASLNGWGVEE